MLYAALLLFCLVAALGIVLVVRLCLQRGFPGWLGIVHGMGGLATLGLLFAGIFTIPHGMVINDAALVFVLVAVLGLTIFALNRDAPTPVGLAIFHGLAAIVAIVILFAGLAIA